jgi:small subunit ribosomal protein S19
MSKTKWKGPVFDKQFFENFQNTKIKIARNNVILPKFLKKTFEVYNGKQVNEVLISEEMIGYKFGEFVSTRKRFFFKKKKTQK